MKRILLVDDDHELCQLLSELLELEGFEVDLRHDGESALSATQHHHYDVIILDVMMPKLNGFDTLRELRLQHNSTPVLMMTARGEEVDRIVGFEMGADDYLPKPCNPRELIARLKAIVRRVELEHQQSSANQNVNQSPKQLLTYQIGDLKLNPTNYHLEQQGQTMELTQTEFKLLQMLMEQAGELVTKDQLMLRVLNRRLAPFDRSIDMHMSNLRRKLGPYPNGDLRIKTLRAQGYMLLLPQASTT